MSDHVESQEQVVDYFAGFIPVTAEGKARARRLLDESAAKRDYSAVRERLGLPAKTA